ncbi:Translation initiation factor eIF-2B subunit delta [Lamellibrachia satsuma]|nr:Translation initiation factor eIF-2B subunit delta [Lamellibrachia satsuma]
MADAAGSQVGGQVRGGGSQGNKGQGGGRKRHRHNRKSQQAKTDDRPQTSEPRASEKGDVDVTATPTQTISSHSLPVTSPSSSMAQASAGQMQGKTQNHSEQTAVSQSQWKTQNCLEHTAVGQTQRKTQNRSEQTALGQSQRKTQNSSEQTAVGQNQQTNQDTSKQILMARNAGKIQEKAEQKQPSADGVELQLAEGLGKGGKTKAQLKAERRAVQEAQRAMKGSKGAEDSRSKKAPPGKKTEGSAIKDMSMRVPDHLKMDDDKARKRMAKKLEKQQVPQRTVVEKKVNLFSHLHQYEHEVSLTQSVPFSSGKIHPAIMKLGLQYAEGVICGSNARCVALLGALKQVISDYVTPPQKELSRDLDAKIKPYISFLTQCRPLSVSMGNAIKYVKWQITHMPTEMSDAKAKELLYERIQLFVKTNILLAAQAISKSACTKIQNEDVILVYACSSLILRVLCDAHKSGQTFRVVVIDSRPKLEGREMLRRLVQQGIPCSYVLISAAAYVMKEVTKVLLGAHALLANGYVMSRVGSSQVALVAKSYNVPVLVCCETYKFCERVQTDSFVFNELGDPDDLVTTDCTMVPLSDWRDMSYLSLLNLVYDVTPPELVSLVITEIGMVPCTSVPVVLRVKNTETDA